MLGFLVRFCFEHFLTFWPNKVWLIWSVFCLSPRGSRFSKEPCFLLLENEVRNQDLDSRCAHCHWAAVLPRPSALIERENRCVYTNQSIKFLYMIVCVDIKLTIKHKHADVSNSNPVPRGSFSPLPLAYL